MAESGSAVDLTALFATPPPEFVAARNALAKQLRADKRRDEAAAVAKLRRPSWVDWALNAAAAADADLLGAFADAAEVLREAQAASIEGREGPDLRAALRALREATTALARRAGKALADADRDPDTAEVTSRLGEVAGQAGAVEQLRAGVLGSADPGDEDLFAGLTPAAPTSSTSSKTPAASKRSKTKTKATTTKAERAAAEDEEDGQRDDAEARAADERERAEEAAAAAARTEERSRLEAAVATVREEVDDAEQRFADAQRALDAARADLDAANERLDAATAELADFDDGADDRDG